MEQSSGTKIPLICFAHIPRIKEPFFPILTFYLGKLG